VGSGVSETAPAAEPHAAPLSPTFVWIEMNRRIDALARRVDGLDEHGSRGINGLRTEVARLGHDLEEHERQHQAQVSEQRTARRFTLGAVIALVTPLYPLVFWLVQK
jgi:hypothetical protein